MGRLVLTFDRSKAGDEEVHIRATNGELIIVSLNRVDHGNIRLSFIASDDVRIFRKDNRRNKSNESVWGTKK